MSEEVSAHLGPLLLGVEVEVKVPDEPVADGGPELERAAQEGAVDEAGDRAPLFCLLPRDGVPGGVLHQPALHRYKLAMLPFRNSDLQKRTATIATSSSIGADTHRTQHVMGKCKRRSD